jgi:conjugal transfer/entry exclusion protein
MCQNRVNFGGAMKISDQVAHRTTYGQNNLSGKRNSSRVAACELQNEQAGLGPLAETVECVREIFVRSPQKSTHRASWELQMAQSNA